MLEFKLWVEEHDLFGNKKKELRQEIITTLEPNKDAMDVTSSRIGEFGTDDSSRHGDHIIDLFNKNPRIWELMSQAFPGEEDTLKNRVIQWLKQSMPQHQNVLTGSNLNYMHRSIRWLHLLILCNFFSLRLY